MLATMIAQVAIMVLLSHPTRALELDACDDVLLLLRPRESLKAFWYIILIAV